MPNDLSKKKKRQLRVYRGVAMTFQRICTLFQIFPNVTTFPKSCPLGLLDFICVMNQYKIHNAKLGIGLCSAGYSLRLRLWPKQRAIKPELRRRWFFLQKPLNSPRFFFFTMFLYFLFVFIVHRVIFGQIATPLKILWNNFKDLFLQHYSSKSLWHGNSEEKLK